MWFPKIIRDMIDTGPPKAPAELKVEKSQVIQFEDHKLFVAHKMDDGSFVLDFQSGHEDKVKVCIRLSAFAMNELSLFGSSPPPLSEDT